MWIHLLRHGIAEDLQGADALDAERSLTPRGVTRTRRALAGLKGALARPSLIYTSPYVRAHQTAAIAGEVLGVEVSGLKIVEALTPDADPREIVAILDACGETDVLCVGHRPHLDRTVALLVGAAVPPTRLKKAGVASLVVEPPQTAHDRRGYLHALYTPAVLRHLA